MCLLPIYSLGVVQLDGASLLMETGTDLDHPKGDGLDPVHHDDTTGHALRVDTGMIEMTGRMRNQPPNPPRNRRRRPVRVWRYGRPMNYEQSSASNHSGHEDLTSLIKTPSTNYYFCHSHAFV